MPVFQLTDELIFPSPHQAEVNGLLAVGGDLSVERLLLAYSSGIFPWFSKGEPILWWSPNPRYIIDPSEMRVSRSLEKLIRKNKFEITMNQSFSDVIKSCSKLREENDGTGTWITKEMIDAYTNLHELGFAHSVETWCKGQLVGGLYGVCLSRCFFGESMFFRSPNASKVAFVALARELRNEGFELIDCQQPSDHMSKFGAKGIRMRDFLKRLVRGGVSTSSTFEPTKLSFS